MLFVVMIMLVKKAFNGGINPIALIALRQFVGAAFLVPIEIGKKGLSEIT
jgi:hypothetical protein